MTKKDYELIAEVFREHNGRYGRRTSAVADELAGDLADVLKRDNPRFDREQFLKACGVNLDRMRFDGVRKISTGSTS